MSRFLAVSKKKDKKCQKASRRGKKEKQNLKIINPRMIELALVSDLKRKT